MGWSLVLNPGGGMNLLVPELAKMFPPVLSDRLVAPIAAALEDFSSGSKESGHECKISTTYMSGSRKRDLMAPNKKLSSVIG